MNKSDQIIQVGNLILDAEFTNPQVGRIYSVFGISPTVVNVAGGGLHAKILIEYDNDNPKP